jgi:transcriptional regulator with XRE-family HTH domain
MYFPESSNFSAIRRRTWAQFFGRYIRSAREQQNSSIEEAAGLAGMETSEWEALEAGQVPTTQGQLNSIAAALDMDEGQIGRLVLLCREAWEM